MKNIRTILIANRGEIAVRIIRTCREMGIRSVAIYSDADRTAMHVRLADEAYRLGGNAPSESYLHQERIIDVALQCKADAIHPGYGFLSENPVFADLVHSKGLIFIGPSGSAIRTLGDKTSARKLARTLGIPTVQGSSEALTSDSEAVAVASEIGYPILIKAAAGGGGKGMRVVRTASDLSSALQLARSEAKTAFHDDRVYIEKYIEGPRHVEIQILADSQGNIIHLGERECSVQRRHQKVIEESPSPALNERMREELGRAAVRLAQAAQYVNAGTLEFLLDRDKSCYFLEMNTRLQVEHPVTEAVTGLDLVREQIRIAEGRALPYRQGDIIRKGYAVECRICAEDPRNQFFPSTGRLERYVPPQGTIRVENGYAEGDVVSLHYDSLLAKVISYGTTRADALASMDRALREFRIEGVETTIPFCRFVLNHPEFASGSFDTTFIERQYSPDHLDVEGETNEKVVAALAAVLLSPRNRPSPKAGQSGERSGDSKWKSLRKEGMRG